MAVKEDFRPYNNTIFKIWFIVSYLLSKKVKPN